MQSKKPVQHIRARCSFADQRPSIGRLREQPQVLLQAGQTSFDFPGLLFQHHRQCHGAHRRPAQTTCCRHGAELACQVSGIFVAPVRNQQSDTGIGNGFHFPPILSLQIHAERRVLRQRGLPVGASGVVLAARLHEDRCAQCRRQPQEPGRSGGTQPGKQVVRRRHSLVDASIARAMVASGPPTPQPMSATCMPRRKLSRRPTPSS